MKNLKSANRLRTHRRKSGLSQRQIGQLLGYQKDGQVSRHEGSKATPLLVSAFGYQVIFRVPIHVLFPGLYEGVRESVEERLRDLETSLQDSTVKGSQAEAIAQTLLWMMDRRERDIELNDAV
jgi:DNA-binding XRE family transcriptional regulator